MTDTESNTSESSRGGSRRRVLWNLLLAPGGFIGAGIIFLVVIIALLAPLISPYDPIAMNLSQKLLPPSIDHLMGTDQAGRDVLTRIFWGGRVSLSIAVLAVALGLLGGVSLGVLAGFYAGTFVDHLVMRIMDVFFSIPLLVWAIAIVGVLGVGPFHIGPLLFGNEAKIILLVGLLYVPSIARVAYSSALIESKADYVMARRAQGARDAALMIEEVLPNCLSPLIVQATLYVAISIVVEASLSFVGLGVQPPAPSWGAMLSDARGYVFSGEWWLPLFPGLAISITVIGFNLLGDALRDTLDPRGRTNRMMV